MKKKQFPDKLQPKGFHPLFDITITNRVLRKISNTLKGKIVKIPNRYWSGNFSNKRGYTLYSIGNVRLRKRHLWVESRPIEQSDIEVLPAWMIIAGAYESLTSIKTRRIKESKRMFAVDKRMNSYCHANTRNNIFSKYATEVGITKAVVMDGSAGHTANMLRDIMGTKLKKVISLNFNADTLLVRMAAGDQPVLPQVEPGCKTNCGVEYIGLLLSDRCKDRHGVVGSISKTAYCLDTYSCWSKSRNDTLHELLAKRAAMVMITWCVRGTLCRPPERVPGYNIVLDTSNGRSMRTRLYVSNIIGTEIYIPCNRWPSYYNKCKSGFYTCVVRQRLSSGRLKIYCKEDNSYFYINNEKVTEFLKQSNSRL